jgi:hypothetical protein
MLYIDSGSRNPDQTLGAWLEAQLNPAVVEVRWQSGYFTAKALGLLGTYTSTPRREGPSDKNLDRLERSGDRA